MSNEQVRRAYDAQRRLVELRLLGEYGGALNSATMETAVRAWGFAVVDRDLVNGDPPRRQSGWEIASAR